MCILLPRSGFFCPSRGFFHPNGGFFWQIPSWGFISPRGNFFSPSFFSLRRVNYYFLLGESRASVWGVGAVIYIYGRKQLSYRCLLMSGWSDCWQSHVSFSFNLSPVCTRLRGQQGFRQAIPVTFTQTFFHFFRLCFEVLYFINK